VLDHQVGDVPIAGSGSLAPEVGLPASLPPVARPSTVVHARQRNRESLLRRTLLAADMVALCLSLAFALVFAGNREAPLLDSLWILATLPAWAVLLRAYGFYNRPGRRFEPTHLDDLFLHFNAIAMGALALWLLYKALPVPRLSFTEILAFGLLTLLLSTGFRVVARRANLRKWGPERIFVVAPLDEVRILRRKLINHPEYGMAVKGALLDSEADEGKLGLELGLRMSGTEQELDELIASREIDHLFVQLDSGRISQGRAVELMRNCQRAGIRYSVFSNAKNLLHPGVEVNHLEGMGFLTYHPPVLSRSSLLIKRILDIVLSSVLLALTAPLMAAIAVAIKLDSEGSVFFRQRRVGQHGERFRLFKFRTMVPDSDAMVPELMSRSIDPGWLIIDDDPRVTRVGRFLRRTSLDELPQLWNVLKGDMSTVGPRPLAERDDEGVQGWGRHRLDLAPGLTGQWQVLGRNSIPFCEMVDIDYAYVTNWSLWLDLKLLMRTIPVVLQRRGAL
jgi:exopolysaccharide biosynthesis polyprenyl glycosylphosphotransferase